MSETRATHDGQNKTAVDGDFYLDHKKNLNEDFRIATSKIYRWNTTISIS